MLNNTKIALYVTFSVMYDRQCLCRNKKALIKYS